ncbi:uncharacterized protein BO97DRAFT_477947 [Aspergillus homomorphus CBS 101889]|uniref:Uncharacterized protein n=1 Tax=Aspergillus homomorphus (strain CBS 101889) TaxID=1450537 RepID=A0A395HWJ4_ASPHC|nr:hypothetical protein BO97DRAFT_477947 [Aspergillus homomorphus CBS 101889]RAL12180.1 hypothetical protein BO97DRAFT_477947 [Aspergillus homomorphus CBS 101889]
MIPPMNRQPLVLTIPNLEKWKPTVKTTSLGEEQQTAMSDSCDDRSIMKVLSIIERGHRFASAAPSSYGSGPDIPYNAIPMAEPDEPDQDSMRIDPIPVRGPRIEFPRHLQAEIAEWYKKNDGVGYKRPPFAYQNHTNKGKDYVVYNRAHRQVELCHYTMRGSVDHVLVLFDESQGPPKLMVCGPPRIPRYGVFLRQWSPQNEDLVPPPCALRIWLRNPRQDIIYEPQAWGYVDSYLRQERGRQSVHEQLNTRRRNMRERFKFAGTKRQRANSSVLSRETSPPADTDFASGSEEPWGEEEHSSEESLPENELEQQRNQTTPSRSPDIILPIAKKRKTNHADPTSMRKVTGGLVFVLCVQDKIRFVPLSNCETVDELFAQALEFFRLHVDLADLQYLCCETESYGEVWLPKGGDDEFDYMICVALNALKEKHSVPAVEIKVRPVIR